MLGGKFSGDMPKLFTQAEAIAISSCVVCALGFHMEGEGERREVLMAGIILGFGKEIIVRLSST